MPGPVGCGPARPPPVSAGRSSWATPSCAATDPPRDRSTVTAGTAADHRHRLPGCATAGPDRPHPRCGDHQHHGDPPGSEDGGGPAPVDQLQRPLPPLGAVELPQGGPAQPGTETPADEECHLVHGHRQEHGHQQSGAPRRRPVPGLCMLLSPPACHDTVGIIAPAAGNGSALQQDPRMPAQELRASAVMAPREQGPGSGRSEVVASPGCDPRLSGRAPELTAAHRGHEPGGLVRPRVQMRRPPDVVVRRAPSTGPGAII